nr:O-antigen ligase family protein [Sphingomonas yunnanensis]
MAAVSERERDWVPALLLALILVSTLIGLLQFSGLSFDHPLLNDTPGDVNGGLANRNHFALLLAIGCLLSFRWAFPDGRSARWRLPLAFGLVLLLLLTILATGSRMGMVLGVVALVIGPLTVRRAIRHELRRVPRWIVVATIGGAVLMIATLILLSVAADRAASIDRAFGMDAAQDIRARALPTVLSMIARYFPVGAGFGGFDPLFRIAEPFRLLKPTYFNHAHDDFLEVLIDGGVAGAVLLLAAVGWWAVASVRAWRGGATNARLGSAALLLVFIASLSDYPARTPIVMAVVAVAATWLATRRERARPSQG